MKLNKYQLVLIGLLSFILIFTLEYIASTGFKYYNFQLIIRKVIDILPTFILVYGFFILSIYMNRK